MKIIIVGAGKVGEYLFTDLNTEDNDIILILWCFRRGGSCR